MDLVADIARYFDPVAALLVVGGSFAAAAFRSTRDDRARAFAALGPMLRADPQAEGVSALRAVNAIEEIAHVRNLAQADRVSAGLPFLRRLARHVAEARSGPAFALWGEDELAARARRHRGAVGFWCAVADAAPAMGMIGTIIGLIGMFANMNDAAAIGPDMALAMLTTLYGVVLSGGIAGPIAARLERLSEAELDWQRDAIERLTRLIRTELDLPARPRLVA